jgi:hypothetical protein
METPKMISLNSLFGPLERLITEHGSAAVLREHLGLIKAQLADYEAKHRDLQAQHQQVQADLLQAQSRARELAAQLQSLTHGQYAGLCCDACGSMNIKRTGSRPHAIFGDLGRKEALFRCSDCGAETATLID